jgi:uncharacterized protein YggU (UPF0235/DUF167 family)
VTKLLATVPDVPRNSLHVISGSSPSNKVMEIAGLDEAVFQERLRAAGH